MLITSVRMIFILVLVPIIGVMADTFVQETSDALQAYPNVTFTHVPTDDVVVDSVDDYSRAICPWTFTIDDNIRRIPRRILVMDETQGLPSTCNGNKANMSDNFTCEAIRRRMKVLWKTQCSGNKCVLEERTITVSVGLTCVHNNTPGNQEVNGTNCRNDAIRETTSGTMKGKGCKGKKKRRDRCRKFCKNPQDGSKRCLRCKQKRKRFIEMV